MKNIHTFDYYKQFDIVVKTQNEFLKLEGEYVKLFTDLPFDTLRNLNFIYFNKKYETIMYQNPKGIIQNIYSDLKNKELKEYVKLIKILIKDYYELDIEVGSEEYNKLLKTICDLEKNNPKSAFNLLEKYKNDLLNTYLKINDYVYIVLPTLGLKEIVATKHRENRYLNEIIDGIYAVSGFEILDYIVRTNTGSMKRDGYSLSLPINPFNLSKSDDFKLVLNKPAAVYILDARMFEPVVDFELKNNHPVIRFGEEWISRTKFLPCAEESVTFIPANYLKYRNIIINGIFYNEMMNNYHTKKS